MIKNFVFGGNYFARGEFVLYINHSGKYIKINFNMKIPYPCQNWYPYLSTHCGTRVSTWLMAWYPYSYSYPFHCTRTSTRTHISAQFGTRTYGLVPVPVPGYLFWYPTTTLPLIGMKTKHNEIFEGASSLLPLLREHHPSCHYGALGTFW